MAEKVEPIRKRNVVSDPEIDALNETYKRGKQDGLFEVEAVKAKLEAAGPLYEQIGKLKTTAFYKNISDVALLLLLKQAKENKTYRHVLGMTWEQFCDRVGIPDRTADRWLAETDLLTTDIFRHWPKTFGGSINDIKYLNKSISENSATVAENGISFEGKTIPWDPDHADEFQALLNSLVATQKTKDEETAAQLKAHDRVQTETHKAMTRLEKELDRLKGFAAKNGRSLEEETFLKKMEAIRTSLDGQFDWVDAEAMFSGDLNPEKNPTDRMRIAYVETVDYLRRELVAMYHMATEYFGEYEWYPEEAVWIQPGEYTGTLPEPIRAIGQFPFSVA